MDCTVGANKAAHAMAAAVTDTIYVKKKTPQGTVSDAGASAQAQNSNVQNVPPQGPSTDSTIAQGTDSVNEP